MSTTLSRKEWTGSRPCKQAGRSNGIKRRGRTDDVADCRCDRTGRAARSGKGAGRLANRFHRRAWKTGADLSSEADVACRGFRLSAGSGRLVQGRCRHLHIGDDDPGSGYATGVPAGRSRLSSGRRPVAKKHGTPAFVLTSAIGANVDSRFFAIG